MNDTENKMQHIRRQGVSLLRPVMALGTTSADVITTQSLRRGDSLIMHSLVHRPGGDVGAQPAEPGHRPGARLPEAGSRGLSESGTAIDHTQYGRSAGDPTH